MPVADGSRDTDPAGSGTLDALCRGLVGYVSYVAACGGYPVYSEYLLYEPILRIGQAQGYRVSGEVPVKKRRRKNSAGRSKGGDHQRIDFDFLRLGTGENRFGLEVKWADKTSVSVAGDVKKLRRHAAKHTGCTGYLLVFGPHDVISELEPIGLGKPIRKSKSIGWSAGKTKYAARWYRVV